MKAAVTINVSAARRGNPSIRIMSTGLGEFDETEAFQIACDLLTAADWASELAVAAPDVAAPDLPDLPAAEPATRASGVSQVLPPPPG